jgi:hypothetical protein
VRRIVFAALIVLPSWTSAHAQTTQVWPEISLFTRLNDRMRFYFLATTVKESQESTEGEFGPNFDFYLQPFRERKRLAGFRLDESKNRFLLLRVGYRYLDSFSGDPDEHRAVLEATARYPLKGGVLVSNRGRIDARFIDGEYSWRFRSRLSVEKECSIGPVRMSPYVRASCSTTVGSMRGAGRSGSRERRFPSTGASSSKGTSTTARHRWRPQPAGVCHRNRAEPVLLIRVPRPGVHFGTYSRTPSGGCSWEGTQPIPAGTHWVQIDLEKDDQDHLISPEERFQIAMARQ